MDGVGASASREDLAFNVQQKPTKRIKKVSFAPHNHVMTFVTDRPIAALLTYSKDELEPAGLGADADEDVEMLDALPDEDDGGVVPSPFNTTNMPAPTQSAGFQAPGAIPNLFTPQLAQPPSDGAAHWQVQPYSLSQPIGQQEAPRPQHVTSSHWDPKTPPHRTRFGDPEINRALDERNGQVRDILDWLLDEARLNGPPRNFHQVLTAAAYSLIEWHDVDANVLHRMIIRHRKPESQLHIDLFHMLEAYLLGRLDLGLFKVLFLLLEDFCRLEQHK